MAPSSGGTELSSLPYDKHRLLTCALIAHQCNSFQSSNFVQLLHFKERFIASTSSCEKPAIKQTSVPLTSPSDLLLRMWYTCA